MGWRDRRRRPASRQPLDPEALERSPVIRRTAFLIPVSIILLALVGTSSVSARDQMALGVSIPNGRDMSALDGFTASLAAKDSGAVQPALWTIWSQWGNPDTKHFPMATANDLAGRGVTPVIWWEPTDPRGDNWTRGKFERYKRIIKHIDRRLALYRYVRDFARDAKAFGKPVILRFAHEANGTWFPWGIGRFDNTAWNFKKAWRKVWRVFRQEGATNVKFLWSVTKQRCPGCNPFAQVFPGHKYVDYAGITAFNWGTWNGRKRWRSMVRVLESAIRDMRRVTSRPIIIAEMASNHRGGNKANWIRSGYKAVYNRWNRVKAVLYLDTNGPKLEWGHPDWRLAKPSDGSALAAYAHISSLERFQGQLP